MASENTGPLLSFEAAADLSTSRYLCATLSASGQAELCNAATDTLLGVIQENDAAAQGEAVTLATQEGMITKVVAGAAVAIGNKLAPDAAAKVQPAVGTNEVCGYALTAAAGANDVIEMLISRQGILA